MTGCLPALAREGWRLRRALWVYRRQGNRDLYLRHASGAAVIIWPRSPDRRSDFAVSLPGRHCYGFLTRRAALAYAIGHWREAWEQDT